MPNVRIYVLYPSTYYLCTTVLVKCVAWTLTIPSPTDAIQTKTQLLRAIQVRSDFIAENKYQNYDMDQACSGRCQWTRHHTCSYFKSIVWWIFVATFVCNVVDVLLSHIRRHLPKQSRVPSNKVDGELFLNSSYVLRAVTITE